MSQPFHGKIKNQILANLSEEESQRIQRHLERVDLAHGKILYEIGEPIRYVYFPLFSMISLVTQMSDGKIVEVGLVGNDGMSGISTIMGIKSSGDRAVVQIPNGAIRVKVDVIQEEFKKAGSLQRNLLNYANALMRQVSQTAACNASHTTEERLSRWLLMCHDRVESDHLNLTQEFIAEMLGTRRATVNVAAVMLQSADLIKYQRGRITIVDRPGLEAFSCECYATLKAAVNQDGHDGRH
jgi:CRP-like cAMP-binding protein